MRLELLQIAAAGKSITTTNSITIIIILTTTTNPHFSVAVVVNGESSLFHREANADPNKHIVKVTCDL